MTETGKTSMLYGLTENVSLKTARIYPFSPFNEFYCLDREAWA